MRRGRVRRGESEEGREGSLVSRTMHTKGEGRGRSMLINTCKIIISTCTIQIFEFLFKRNCLTDPDCISRAYACSGFSAAAAHAPVSPPPAPRRAPPPG